MYSSKTVPTSRIWSYKTVIQCRSTDLLYLKSLKSFFESPHSKTNGVKICDMENLAVQIRFFTNGFLDGVYSSAADGMEIANFK